MSSVLSFYHNELLKAYNAQNNITRHRQGMVSNVFHVKEKADIICYNCEKNIVETLTFYFHRFT